jgi:UDP-glucose 4-epimerase
MKGDSSMRILVTGGAGYIGGTATSMLLDKGYDVTVLDDLSTGHRDSVDPRAKFMEGSLIDAQSISNSLAGCDAVMHFAAKALVGESVEKPELYHEINVNGSKNLLAEMKVAGINRIVFSSSCATYGQPESSPISESAPTLPINPYGKSKLDVDKMLTEAAEDWLGAVSLRYFNVAGALKVSAGWLAERHETETHLIPNILKATSEKPLNIFGTDWPTPDGTCIRDYIHVIDLIDAHIKALALLEIGTHRIFNLGSGTGHSVAEVIAAATNAVERAIPCENSSRRAGDPAVLVADITRAKSELGWAPTHSLEEIVQDTWESQKSLQNSKV